MATNARERRFIRARLKVGGGEPEKDYFRQLSKVCRSLYYAWEGGPRAVEEYLAEQEAAVREAFALIREELGLARRDDAA